MIKKRQNVKVSCSNIIDEELLYQHDIKNLDYSVLISLPMKTTTVQEHLLQSYKTPNVLLVCLTWQLSNSLSLIAILLTMSFPGTKHNY